MFLRDLFRFLPRSTLRRALSLMNRGEFENAAALFDALLEQQPQPPRDLAVYACQARIEHGSVYCRNLAADRSELKDS